MCGRRWRRRGWKRYRRTAIVRRGMMRSRGASATADGIGVATGSMLADRTHTPTARQHGIDARRLEFNTVELERDQGTPNVPTAATASVRPRESRRRPSQHDRDRAHTDRYDAPATAMRDQQRGQTARCDVRSVKPLCHRRRMVRYAIASRTVVIPSRTSGRARSTIGSTPAHIDSVCCCPW
jgi:hypothetical protein